jgi:antitoxin (DNA-binding transcriptional repressor) of toxin-antitoxin stability system
MRKFDTSHQSGQVGHVITTTISDTKNRLSELLTYVQAGETLIIVDRKTPVARVERIRGVIDNPHILPARKKWNAESILNLPIMSARKASPNLVEAVSEERETGW